MGNTLVSGGTAKATCSGHADGDAAISRSNVCAIATLTTERKDSMPKLAGLGAARTGSEFSVPMARVRGQIFGSGARRVAHSSGSVTVFGRSGVAGTT